MGGNSYRKDPQKGKSMKSCDVEKQFSHTTWRTFLKLLLLSNRYVKAAYYKSSLGQSHRLLKFTVTLETDRHRSGCSSVFRH